MFGRFFLTKFYGIGHFYDIKRIIWLIKFNLSKNYFIIIYVVIELYIAFKNGIKSNLFLFFNGKTSIFLYRFYGLLLKTFIKKE